MTPKVLKKHLKGKVKRRRGKKTRKNINLAGRRNPSKEKKGKEDANEKNQFSKERFGYSR